MVTIYLAHFFMLQEIMQQKGQEVQNIVQEIASGKIAFTIGASTASMPWWVQFVHGELFQAIVIIIGVVLSLTVIAVNIFSLSKMARSFMRRYKKLS